jgi:serine/threonine protein phosphatase PrpC
MTSEDSGMPVAGDTLTCPGCSGPVSEGDRFCEACGAELAPGAGVDAVVVVECRECGGEVGADGYCTQCGTRAVSQRDHFTEQPAPWVAGVCDRGVHHSRNEDALALYARPAPGSHAVLVVCDGVSSSTDSDVASLAAARAARDLLSVSDPHGLGTTGARVTATARALEAAANAASDAVIAHTTAGPGNPASCTFVAAVIDQSLLVIGWVGDSRAYWLPDEGAALLLSIDDSFAAEQIAQGVPRPEAETGPQAHAITRWLGIDAPDHTPQIASVDLDGPGWVLVCSDGLWNYSSDPQDVAALVRETAPAAGEEPLDLAEALVAWANAQGGRDNITVALARVGEPTFAATAAYRKEGTPDGDILS